jgi:molybdopterin converting factor small subunit
MKIELNLYASLRAYLPPANQGETKESTEVREGTTVRELLAHLGVPVDAVKIMFLNGVHANGDEMLKEGDRLGVFPPVAGG